MGPKWTQKIIIQGESGLKQLIVGKRHKSPYDAFTLLGIYSTFFSSFLQEYSLITNKNTIFINKVTI